MMKYVDGFLVAVPAENKEVYRKHAEDAWPMFRDYGALSMVECWGDDVPDGQITSINAAVLRKADEVSLFSWISWPDKATRDAAVKSMTADMQGPSAEDMPFDGSRMIYGGFEVLSGDPLAGAAYINGTVMPVLASQREAYREAAIKLAEVFAEHGAVCVVDCWQDDLPEGKVNDFHTAILRKPEEAVVFSWVGWKDRAAQDAGWEKIMADPRMEEFGPQTVGGDLQRMIFGSFIPIVDAL